MQRDHVAPLPPTPTCYRWATATPLTPLRATHGPFRGHMSHGASKGNLRGQKRDKVSQCQMTQHSSRKAKKEQHKQWVAPSHFTFGHQPTQILELTKTSRGCAFMLCKVIWESHACVLWLWGAEEADVPISCFFLSNTSLCINFSEQQVPQVK